MRIKWNQHYGALAMACVLLFGVDGLATGHAQPPSFEVRVKARHPDKARDGKKAKGRATGGNKQAVMKLKAHGRGSAGSSMRRVNMSTADGKPHVAPGPEASSAGPEVAAYSVPCAGARHSCESTPTATTKILPPKK